MSPKIIQPTLVLNKTICLQNIKTMIKKAKRNKTSIRPHFKTHQSQKIGDWFRQLGIDKIAVSSLKMAVYFAEDGWKDITVAIPVNVLEIDRINSLAASIQLNLVVESLDVVEILDAKLQHRVNCFIKLDTGYGRTGIPSDNHPQISQLIDSIQRANKLKFLGFLAHEGHSYSARTQSELSRIHKDHIQKINAVARQFVNQCPTLIQSVGSTPICGGLENFEGADEVRPGNFVFFDLMQQRIGACDYSEIAVALACPIIAVHEDRNLVIIHGGGVHFSKDFLTLSDGTVCYGQVAETLKDGWGKPVPNAIVRKISQEHGTIVGPADFVKKCRVGQLLYILPVHSCMTANLMKSYHTTDEQIISMMP